MFFANTSNICPENSQQKVPHDASSVKGPMKLRLEVHANDTDVYYQLVSAVVKLVGLDFVTT